MKKKLRMNARSRKAYVQGLKRYQAKGVSVLIDGKEADDTLWERLFEIRSDGGFYMGDYILEDLPEDGDDDCCEAFRKDFCQNFNQDFSQKFGQDFGQNESNRSQSRLVESVREQGRGYCPCATGNVDDNGMENGGMFPELSNIPARSAQVGLGTATAGRKILRQIRFDLVYNK